MDSRRWRFLAISALLVGCGSGGAMTTTDGPPAGGDGGCPQMQMSPSAPANGRVDGTWAALEITLARVNGFDSPQVARNIYLYQHAAGAGAVIETLCHLQIDDANGLISTRVLPSFAPGIPKQQRMDSITPDGHYVLAKHWITRGVTLANIETDPLPTDPADPRIGDWDMDGHPGMTLLLTGLLMGKAYVIQRDWSVFDGHQIDADHIEGLVQWDTQQIYLASDPNSIKMLAPASHPDPDPSKHTFQLVHLPDSADCAYVLAHECTLFHP